MLYQLSYSRLLNCGRRWIRTTEDVRQQIYSLPHLATLVFALKRASCRIRTNDPEITNHVLWPTELKRQYLLYENELRFRKSSANIQFFNCKSTVTAFFEKKNISWTITSITLLFSCNSFRLPYESSKRACVELQIMDRKQLITITNCRIDNNQKTIVPQLTWHMNEGEAWLVIGPNGGGKADFVNALAGSYSFVPNSATAAEESRFETVFKDSVELVSLERAARI